MSRRRDSANNPRGRIHDRMHDAHDKMHNHVQDIHSTADEHHRKYSGIFAGIILLVLGVILLLNTLGVIKFSVWSGLSTYWPIGLILIGIAIILRLRWLTLTFLIITIVLCTAFLADTLHTEHIQGSGVIISKNYNVKDFNKLQLKIPAQVYLTQGSYGSAPNVTIVGDDNILDMVNASVEDGTLVLRYAPDYRFWNFWNDNGLKVYITTPNINSIQVDGAGSIKSSSPIVTDNMKILISGAGDVDMNIVASNLDTDISGFGNLRLNGTANEYHVTISGAGDIEAYDLSTKNTTIQVSGSGDAHVNVSGNLDVSISGAGDVKYLGNPQVVEHISGAGSITKVE